MKGIDKKEAHRHISTLIDGFLDYTTGRLSSITRYNTYKAIKRQSVMEHSGAVTLIAMTLSDYLNEIGIVNDTERVIRMAIIHDADEVVSGDIPHDAKYRQGEASERLRKALDELTSYNITSMVQMLPNKKMQKKYMKLFNEEKRKQTRESKIVKLADRAEAAIYCKHEAEIGNKAFQMIYDIEIGNIHKGIDELLGRSLKD